MPPETYALMGGTTENGSEVSLPAVSVYWKAGWMRLTPTCASRTLPCAMPAGL